MEDPVIKPLKRTMTESQLGNIEKAREKKSQYDAVRKEEAKIKRAEKNYEKMMDLLGKMQILNPPAPEPVAPPAPVSQIATPIENAKVVIKKSKKRSEHIMKTVAPVVSDVEDETATETDDEPPPPPPPILKEKRPRPVPVVNVSKRQIIFG